MRQFKSMRRTSKLKFRNPGKIRYIGFTGHKDPLVHLRMLEIAANHKFRFDAVQMPLNVMDAHFRSFEHEVLPLLLKDEIGVLEMESGRFRGGLQATTDFNGGGKPRFVDHSLDSLPRVPLRTTPRNLPLS
jgi:aryl-alcohol dehydrogenase-like predicted oxidoreductase